MLRVLSCTDGTMRTDVMHSKVHWQLPWRNAHSIVSRRRRVVTFMRMRHAHAPWLMHVSCCMRKLQILFFSSFCIKTIMRRSLWFDMMTCLHVHHVCSEWQFDQFNHFGQNSEIYSKNSFQIILPFNSKKAILKLTDRPYWDANVENLEK